MATQVFHNVERTVRKQGKQPSDTATLEREIASVEVTVDMVEIARKLAHKALENKSGTSSYLHGLVVVTVLKRGRA